MTSNPCKNFFSILVKHTCGKRIYFGRKDVWYVKSLFAAAKIGNFRITDDVRAAMGVADSPLVRENAIEAELKEKKYNTAYKKTEKCKTRRKQQKFVTKLALQKNATDPARHKTEKMSSKEDCRSTGKAKSTTTGKTKKRKTPCTNCKEWHPGKCPEPNYRMPTKSRKKQPIFIDLG